jgi:hypothetical protein
MRIDGAQPPTNPFHIARAYGVQNVGGAGAASRSQSVQKPAAVEGAVPQQTLPSAAQKLVAAVVPGRVDFSGETPRPGAGLQMYRHPADKNAAATGVQLGRSLDVSG